MKLTWEDVKGKRKALRVTEADGLLIAPALASRYGTVRLVDFRVQYWIAADGGGVKQVWIEPAGSRGYGTWSDYIPLAKGFAGPEGRDQ